LKRIRDKFRETSNLATHWQRNYLIRRWEFTSPGTFLKRYCA